MPIVQGREYRALALPLATSAAGTTTKRFQSDQYIEGYATTFGEAYTLCGSDGVPFREVIARDALAGADLSDVIMQYNHEGRVLARMSNGTLGIEADDVGLFVYADLSRSAAAREMYEEIASGLVTKMSWAFRVAEDDIDKTTRTRTILRIRKVFDVSAVSYPANPGTDIAARSLLNGAIEWGEREALARRAQLLRLKIKLEV